MKKVASKKAPVQAPVCQTCFGHGYRIRLQHATSVNAESAKRWKLRGRRVPCTSCGKWAELVAAHVEKEALQ